MGKGNYQKIIRGLVAAAAIAAGPASAQRPAPAPVAGQQEDGQWTMPAKTYSSTRYSALNQINTTNVRALRPEFTFSTGVTRGQEAAPIVVGGTMYIVSPYPNYVYALDLTKPGAPLKWKFEPKPLPASQGVACCDVVNRGGVFWQGKFIFNTLDGQTIALNADTGAQVWRTKLGDINKGETITMAPLVVKGKVLVGNSGGEMGVRGWLTALDANSGKIAWRAYHTGPDKDVLIGPEFKPFYASERGTDLGVKTWPPQAWRIGGGSVWGWISYDPELDLIYYGTGNPGPWNPEQRPGDNKWTAGIFARDPDTGAARWFYQFSPHDMHDYDAVNENLLLDLPVGGRARKVIVRMERNGYVYVLDRATGQVLSADPYVNVNSSRGVDLRSGRLIVNPEKAPKVGRVIRDICPSANGAKDWNPAAWSPRTRLVYSPTTNLCMDFQSAEVNYIAGTPYVGAEVRMFAGAGGYRGTMMAWDPVGRRKVWEIKEDLPVWSGTLTTGGDLVFYGTLDGWLKAADARSGRVLWSYKTGSGIIGQPISYRGPDGRQYVAILSGVGGWAGVVVSAGLDPRDPTAALGMAGATADLRNKTTPGGTLYVFALPGR